uniref:Uncharacterized protein n=1 Tax=Arundo donax TaxID=35708 RepID=A0A0A9EN29_ARUDO
MCMKVLFTCIRVSIT